MAWAIPIVFCCVPFLARPGGPLPALWPGLPCGAIGLALYALHAPLELPGIFFMDLPLEIEIWKALAPQALVHELVVLG